MDFYRDGSRYLKSKKLKNLKQREVKAQGKDFE
jgi:hypothetical protein